MKTGACCPSDDITQKTGNQASEETGHSPEGGARLWGLYGWICAHSMIHVGCCFLVLASSVSRARFSKIRQSIRGRNDLDVSDRGQSNKALCTTAVTGRRSSSQVGVVFHSWEPKPGLQSPGVHDTAHPRGTLLLLRLLKPGCCPPSSRPVALLHLLSWQQEVWLHLHGFNSVCLAHSILTRAYWVWLKWYFSHQMALHQI